MDLGRQTQPLRSDLGGWLLGIALLTGTSACVSSVPDVAILQAPANIGELCASPGSYQGQVVRLEGVYSGQQGHSNFELVGKSVEGKCADGVSIYLHLPEDSAMAALPTGVLVSIDANVEFDPLCWGLEMPSPEEPVVTCSPKRPIDLFLVRYSNIAPARN